jgi:hypothetical protein
MPNKNHGRIIEIRMIAPMIEDEVPMNILRESAIRVSIKSRRITTTYRPVSCRWCQCLFQWYEYHTRPHQETNLSRNDSLYDRGAIHQSVQDCNIKV